MIDPYARDPDQNLYDLYGPPAEFMLDFANVLLRRHIDTSALQQQGSDLYALAAKAWADPDVRRYWSIFTSTGVDPTLGSVTLSEVYNEIDAQLFSPSKSSNGDLLSSGLGLLQQSGISLTAEQQQYVVQGAGGAGNANDIRSIIIEEATKAGVDPALALAIAEQESGLNPNAIGDNGHSVGLFQLHDQGEGAGMTVEQREDPHLNARIALAEVARVQAEHPDWTPGQIAAAAQRPADPTIYADTINGYYSDIKAGKLPTQTFTTTKNKALTSLESLWPGAVSAFKAAYGRKPTLAELQSLVADNPNDAQLKQRIDAMPSHIPGMNNGQYASASYNLNTAMQAVFGHDGTDAMVKEFFDRGAGLAPTAAKDWVMSWDIHNNMDPKLYNQIWQASKPTLESIYNQSGFDPRIAAHIAATNNLAPPTPTQAAQTAEAATPPIPVPQLQQP